MASLLTPLIYSFLPGYIADALLPTVCAAVPGVFPPAPKNSPQYARNHRIVASILVGLYVVWDLAHFVSGSAHPNDFYILLGVHRGVGEEVVKRAFRVLSRQHHPDRTGGDDEGFVRLRQAYEVLQDPVRRWAYDRFGPRMIEWPAQKSVRAYVREGLLRSIGFYLVSLGVMLLLYVTGQPRHGSYWRSLLLLALLAIELHLILSPSGAFSLDAYAPPVLSAVLFPVNAAVRILLDRPQYQLISLAHHAFNSLGVGIMQLAGIWTAGRSGDQQQKEWQALQGLIMALEAEATGGWRGEIGAMLGPLGQAQGAPAVAEMEERLLSGMEQVLVDRTIASHPGVSPAWRTAALRAATVRPANSGLSGALPDPNMQDLRMAAAIPLPPSPPPSPLLPAADLPTKGARRRHVR